MSKSINKYLLRTLSILMAASLWFYVLNAEPMETTRKVPINFIIPTGKAIANIVPKEVTLKISGARSFLSSAFMGDSVVINLNTLYKGRKLFPVSLTRDMLPNSFGIKVISFSPKVLDIELDRLIKKEVPIKAQFIGDLPSEYKFIKQDVSPEKVMIEGPLSIMRKTALLKSEMIDLTRLTGSGHYKIDLDNVDPRIKINFSDSYQFSYEIRARKSNFTIKNVPIRFVSSNRHLSSKTNKVSVSVLASEGVKEGLRKRDIQVLADIPEARSGWIRVKLKAILPKDVHLLKIEPEQITVRVK